jgi:hypothetical protein
MLDQHRPVPTRYHKPLANPDGFSSEIRRLSAAAWSEATSKPESGMMRIALIDRADMKRDTRALQRS